MGRSSCERLATSQFVREFSAYLDGFMRCRSVLTSSLFPDKPELMWLGYRYSFEVLIRLSAWLRERVIPEEFGASLRRPAAPANGLHLGSVLWVYLFARLGYEISREVPRSELDDLDDRGIIEFWRRVHEGYRRLALPFAPDSVRFPNFSILDQEAVGNIASQLQTVQRGLGQSIQRSLANFASYSWLLECESRQGGFSHGPYPLGDGSALVVREFNDLAGTTYPWSKDFREGGVPPGQIAVVLRLVGAGTSFDLLGVAQISPESYGSLINGVGVLSPEGSVLDPMSWLENASRAVSAAHGQLFARVAEWTRLDRFRAQGLSYAKIWSALTHAAGGTRQDELRIVSTPYDETLVSWLAEHAERDEQPMIWSRVKREEETLLDPIFKYFEGDTDRLGSR